MPPPIFQTNVLFYHNSSINEYSYLSDFSSGERQLLNNISSVIYHLRNINSVSNRGLIKYKYVNLVFEEIELYFHPEYQRKYIDFLIRSIRKEKLKNIFSINICFITHSPYILSDIPSSNILRLNLGEPNKPKEYQETFGSNIHKLLSDDFFLDKGFIGEFAKNRINAAFEALLNKNKNTEIIPDYIQEYIRDTISFIGEPIIKQQLELLYESSCGKEKYIQWVDKELERLNIIKEDLKP